jgi:endogenous inhibitor of DNA gyrase (YacG/DUF329 family)
LNARPAITVRDASAGVNFRGGRRARQVAELTAFVGRRYDHPVRTCPTCRTAIAWHGNPHRPFCSLTCRLIDLGVWLDERHRVAEDADSDPVAVEGDVP